MSSETDQQEDEYDDLLPEDSIDVIAYVEGMFAGFFSVGAILFFDLSISAEGLLVVGGIGLAVATIWEFKHDL